jgi:GntR family transcriptional regulator
VPEPRYRQIADDLQRKIETGQLAHGAQLLTQVELMEEYSASRNTVSDAIKWLIVRGLVETRPGQGTFVVEKIDPFVIILRPETGFGLGEGAPTLPRSPNAAEGPRTRSRASRCSKLRT